MRTDWMKEIRNSDVRRVAQRARPLLLGINARRQIDEFVPGGTGVIIAPNLALTAKHIGEEFTRLDSRYPHLPLRGAYQAEYGCMATHVHAPLTWSVNELWKAQMTDIALLRLAPEIGQTDRDLETRPFEWRLLPPPVGACVLVIGLVQDPEVPVEGQHSRHEVVLHSIAASVTDVYPSFRDRSLLPFPCFEIAANLPHGLSGSPAFFEDKLCGIVSASTSFDDTAKISSLWPLVQMTYDGNRRFIDLLAERAVEAVGWSDILRRASCRLHRDGPPLSEYDPRDPWRTFCLELSEETDEADRRGRDD